MKRRSAVTLTEVLVALFVMALGMVAILTLFPMGALSMAQAIKDDRAGHIGGNAFAIASMCDLPNRTGIAAQFGALGAQPNGPSCPVYVDPIGSIIYSGQPLGGVIPRVNAGFTNQRQILELFALQDDLNFGPNGVPRSPVHRTGSFSWAYMLRRPRFHDQQVVDITVVVYSGRSLVLRGGLTPSDETSYSATPGGPRSLNVPGLSGRQIPRGTWILDVTRDGGLQYGPVHAFFYRVVGQSANGAVLDLQTPLRAPCNQILVMDTVVEVFEKGPDWKP
ncbi:MAG: hypothetical protein ACK4RK_07930 [Gemmataceae bacterium]